MTCICGNEADDLYVVCVLCDTCACSIVCLDLELAVHSCGGISNGAPFSLGKIDPIDSPNPETADWGIKPDPYEWIRFTLDKKMKGRGLPNVRSSSNLRYKLYSEALDKDKYILHLIDEYLMFKLPGIRMKEDTVMVSIHLDIRRIIDLQPCVSSRHEIFNCDEARRACRRHKLDITLATDPGILTVIVSPQYGRRYVVYVEGRRDLA